MLDKILNSITGKKPVYMKEETVYIIPIEILCEKLGLRKEKILAINLNEQTRALIIKIKEK